jgi:hypothetical protein
VQSNDNEPRILVIDIETKLFEAYLFGIRDQYVTHKQIKNDFGGRLIHMVGMKWLGKRKTEVLTEWDHGYEGMMQRTHAAMCEADAIIGYNSIVFDTPKIEGQFALLNMALPPKPTQIDLYKTVRKMGFVSSKLDYVAPLFGLGGKVKHDGMEMWKAASEGCPKARARMTRYCAGDVRLTEDLFHRLKPYIRNLPRLRSGGRCGRLNCQSDNVQHRGYTYTAMFKTERLFCNDCRLWSEGKRVRA